MVWRVSEPAGSTDIPVGAGYIRDNNAQLQTVVTSTRLTNGTAIPDYVPTGQVIWFYANSAPTGYTIVSGPSDELLAVKGGSTYGTGGAQAGTWQQTGHALTTSELPPHSHASNATTQANSGGGPTIYTYGTSNPQTGTTLTSGGSATAHNHGSTWRPLARVGILCEKS